MLSGHPSSQIFKDKYSSYSLEILPHQRHQPQLLYFPSQSLALVMVSELIMPPVVSHSSYLIHLPDSGLVHQPFSNLTSIQLSGWSFLTCKYDHITLQLKILQ